ncbi:MAG: hypothetical protein IJB43_06040, partial [Clostridia bacterium]|nr:hypothetical protein [Clostridia bacterium]
SKKVGVIRFIYSVKEKFTRLNHGESRVYHPQLVAVYHQGASLVYHQDAGGRYTFGDDIRLRR